MYNTNITDRLNKGIDRAKELKYKIIHIEMNKDQFKDLLSEENGNRTNWAVALADYKGYKIIVREDMENPEWDNKTPIKLIIKSSKKKIKDDITREIEKYIEC